MKHPQLQETWHLRPRPTHHPKNKRRKSVKLRQYIITILCYILRVPFALLNTIRRPFTQRVRQHPQSILVIKPCCLGDLLMTTPLLEVIRHAFPQASITYVAGTYSKVVPEHHPVVNTVIDSGTVGIPGRYSFYDYMKLANVLCKHHFDLAFVLDRSPMLTLLPWLAGVPRRVGPDSLGRGFSLTDRVPISTSPTRLQHQAEIYLDLARAIGLPINNPRMHFEPTAEELSDAVGADLSCPPPINRPMGGDEAPSANPTHTRVAVFPGGGSNPGMELTAKRWPLERYREIVHRLARELDAEVLLIGGPEDIDLNQRLLEELDLPQGAITNLAGKTTIGQLAAQLEQCALFIGNDSSPMHLAAAVGIPVIAIFGPTSPQEYGPYPLDDPKHIAIWHHPTGQPCFFLGKMQTSTPCTCIQSVTVDEVWDAVRLFLPVRRLG
jgi:ADP-heptose:LPS heptosyltransferase